MKENCQGGRGGSFGLCSPAQLADSSLFGVCGVRFADFKGGWEECDSERGLCANRSNASRCVTLSVRTL